MTKKLNQQKRAGVVLGKGGVAKSTTVGALSYSLEKMGVRHDLFSIEQHGDMLFRLRPNTRKIQYSEARILDAIPDLDPIFEAACNRHVICDTGANTVGGVVEWMRTTNLIEVAESENIRIAFAVFALSDSPDCIDFIRRLHSFAKQRIDWFVLKSPVQKGDFPGVQEIANEIGAQVITVPRVPDWLLTQCTNHSLNLTTEEFNPQVPILMRQRIRGFGHAYNHELKPLLDYFTQ